MPSQQHESVVEMEGNEGEGPQEKGEEPELATPRNGSRKEREYGGHISYEVQCFTSWLAQISLWNLL